MNENSNKGLHTLLHPYLFVLKEGGEIHNNLLDFSLLMLQVSPPEIIPSPGAKRMLRYAPTRIHMRKFSAEESSPSSSDVGY